MHWINMQIKKSKKINQMKWYLTFFKVLSLSFFAASLISVMGCSSNIKELKDSDHKSEKIKSNKSENIIAHWTFDSSTGLKIEDKSGYNDGIVKGIVDNGFIRKGLYGKAAYFERGKCHINVPHSNELSLTDDFTIECVIMPFAVDSFRTIIWKGYRKVSPQSINFFVDIRDGKIELKTKKKDGGWIVYSTSRPVVEKNKWYDIIITYKGGVVQFYINGDLKDSGSSGHKASGEALLANQYDITIGTGADHIESNYSFHGLIDEIKISKGTIPKILTGRQNDFAKREIEYRCKELEKQASKMFWTVRKLSKAAIAHNDLAAGDLHNKKNVLNELEQCLKETATQSDVMEKLNKIINAFHYKKFFATNGGANAPFTLSVMPGYKRLVKKARFYDDLKKIDNVISIEMAKNEREGFQVLLLGNPFKDISDIKVSVEDLKQENGEAIINSRNIEWGPVGSIETTQPEIAVDFVGKIPDVIMEGYTKINVSKSDFTPIFFRVFLDKNVKSGHYRGKIKFSKGKYIKEVCVKLKVYNFTLPEKNSLIVAFSFFEHFYQRWYGYKTLTEKQKIYIYNFLLKYRIPPNNIYSRKGCYPDIKFLKKLASRGGNFCTLRTLSGKKVRSKEKVDAILNAYRRNINDLKVADLYKYAYWYGYDELGVHKSMMKSAKQMMPKIINEFPNLKLMQTSFPTKEIADLFNVWVPSFAYFVSKKNLKILKDIKKKQNGEIWWYNAGAPKKPFPNYFLDYPVFDCRIIMNLSYMYKVKGILYWCINREWSTNYSKGKQWPEVAWKPYIYNVFSKKRVHKNGMGNFTYPGPNGKIYPSLRLENFRDGIEDYEYYKLLEQRIADLKKNNPTNPLIKKAEKLLSLPSNVAKAVNNFSPNPENLIQHRKQVAKMIMRLSNEKWQKRR